MSAGTADRVPALDHHASPLGSSRSLRHAATCLASRSLGLQVTRESFHHPRQLEETEDAMGGPVADTCDSIERSKVILGQELVLTVLLALAQSPCWKDSMLVTYDEHGGFYDHVDPKDYPCAGERGRGPREKPAAHGPMELSSRASSSRVEKGGARQKPLSSRVRQLGRSHCPRCSGHSMFVGNGNGLTAWRGV